MEYVLRTKYDPYTHHVYDIDTLEEIIYGLTDDETMTKRIIDIAERMEAGDGFATDGIVLTCGEEDVENDMRGEAEGNEPSV